MSIVPQASPTVPRWRARTFPGTLSRTSAARADVRTDLAGFGGELVETVALCGSEDLR
ncbi:MULTISPECIES: hypothetical protein [Nocardiopsis]|uniref:Uncharacterized protein n=1 Tax=Nocardiopsis dassonvillei (strain ATCC 23218 / DSM 43111 / CIP 107115 / JCM 7437 / KCTC 9190 / NBRC 14626 / NCTC 10488 / NRRL B-5397 / IMRU 509) TaxID=446468 RepID=D7B0A3_NOCDD|nr:hypothetical protein [Nocardiopsis dassonvillei]ADH70191.1 conserved hypothetical protein [Nocardiopsis dassonvillei subsp. dassonvillei DSM 43111]VEI90709.1 Uncharacterised protein [Nocardiopsis dassonvillei]